MDEDEQSLYAGLQALSNDAFPKKCNNCGRSFDSPDAFIRQSEAVFSGSGLQKSTDDDDQPVVMLFRNCLCGSTLMDLFSDRRVTTQAGAKRRALFDRLVQVLQHRGLELEPARIELRRLIKGERSTRLEAMGIHLELKK
ncbi:hypothetical protein [Marinobacter sp. SS21]|uniref:hypothetical protein n=1 Tax=Marinobacter sp. SS21 TaxID=2979460 RepID=UPI002330E21A|nr:hypothetical protein [Marinobacter sp. SS21]MDC0663768.1 hypothetical protein [Marinobacter sp. SS21]